MTRPTDPQLLAFLEGSLDEAARGRLLDALERDPLLAQEVRRAARGLEALDATISTPAQAEPGPPVPEHPTPGPGVVPSPSPGVSPWWLVAAAAATVALAVPSTLWVTGAVGEDTSVGLPMSGRPEASEPSFVLVLQGTWPDAQALPEGEANRRASEYWAWTSELADRDVLLAAGDLAWEPGARLGSAGRSVPAGDVTTPDFVVGMFAVRARSLEEAEAIARECPHLRYGGSVSVRRVGAGFVTTGGFGDWEG